MIEPVLQAHIGKQLRRMYDAMIREPVPDRFRLLLDRLEEGEGAEDSLQEKATTGADEAGAV
ncbi:NepR family anti-sigma factor [Rhodoblastus sp.]|uniref:NepR family anti-sigma factor n=1 Tax=Rhodoblastus sp. TaxID=1962975 RepID=UPI003F9D1911